MHSLQPIVAVSKKVVLNASAGDRRNCLPIQ